MPATVTVVASPDDLPANATRVVIGRRDMLDADVVREWLPAGVDDATWAALLGKGDPGDDGRHTSTWVPDEPPIRLFALVLPERVSRHNSTTRAWAYRPLLANVPKKKASSILVALDRGLDAPAAAAAVGRAFALYSAKASDPDVEVDVAFVSPDGGVPAPERLQPVVDATRHAASWVDRPTNVFGVVEFVEQARAVADAYDDVQIEVIAGDDVSAKGLSGLWAVGKAALTPPALVVLRYTPDAFEGHDGWVGKGIVYDTGGLSLKTKTGMPGMKGDMGGAAAVLAAFEATVRLGLPRAVTAVLCLAENAIGPAATRPDDVIQMHSGKTVEVNNTDAEGRLVLADGASWLFAHHTVDRVFTLATLTGAQAIATGREHAAIVCSDDDLEAAAIDAGRRTGDLVHPLPFAPELLFREFRSPIADMKNSVKDRANAQSSCAAEFVRRHFPDDHAPWLHVDLAAPATRMGRGTGFGVGLLLDLSGAWR